MDMANDLTREVDDLRAPLRLRAETANDEALTIECVIATERAVPTIDRERWEMVDEVLVAGGCREVDSVVMLDSHRRDSVKRIYGSLRNVRINGAEVESTLVFDDSPDPREAYGKAKRGHLRDVSAGYRVLAYTDIRAGETSTISGREYTAGARTLRVATDWELREGSLVPIGADRDAKIRSIYEDGASARASNQEELAMKPKDQVDQPGGEAPREEGARAERERILEITKRGRAASIAHETIAAAIEAGESPDAASARFLASISATRAPAVGATSSEEAEVSAPDIHIRSGASNVPPQQRLRDLGFGLRHAIGAPVKPIAEVVTDYERSHRDATIRARSEGVAPPEARVFGISDAARGVPGAERLSAADYARSAEEGYRFRDLSLLDYLRESIEIATGRRAPRGGQAVINAYADLCQGVGIRAAGVSVSDLQNVFTDSVAAQLIAAYELAGDTTEFVRVTDIADFRSQPRPRATPLNPMGLLPDSGAQPADMNALGDTTESYRAARFADQFALDERAFIDDRLDLFSTIPRAMGQNAGQVRPDGVYFILLNGATAGLAAGAIFSSGNGNYVASSGALGSTTLQTAIAAMETQVEASANGSNRILNIEPKYLVTGKATRWTGLELMNSTMIVASGGTSQAVRGSTNVLANALTVVSDARFDKGVRDPFSKTPTTVAADPDGWAVVADQRYPTIEVGYVRATGRAPVIRPYMLIQGQWGMGWDIKLDLGVKALDYRGLYYSKGA